MAEKSLSQFYSQLSQLVAPTYRLLLALQNPEKERHVAIGADIVESLSDLFSICAAANEYCAQEKRWSLIHGVWRHSGKKGEEPIKPPWPSEIPKNRTALWSMGEATKILTVCKEFQKKETKDELSRFQIESSRTTVEYALQNFILSLNEIETSAMEKGNGQNGTINRNVLAKVIGVTPKTLANRADELPLPIDRTSRQVPIYLFDEARAALVKMYPDKEGIIPTSAEEAISRASQLSNSGSEETLGED